jgi:DNA-binding MarR family transcriptional regulator
MKDEEIMTESPILEHSGDESHLLREIYRTNQAMFNNVSRIMGASASRVALVRLLATDMPDGGGVMEIARRLGINAAAVTRLVKELEEQKWVRRRGDAADARRTHISLTAKGQKRVREIHERMHAFERSFDERIGTEDVRTTVRVLSEVRAALAEFRLEASLPPAGL